MNDFVDDLRVNKAVEFVKENAVVDNTITSEESEEK